MAAQKQQRAELLAIYRLEFYKKQKNWKLSVDARKEKHLNSCPNAAVQSSKVLNETYSIENNVDEEVNVLNDAFLKDESDKDTPVSATVQSNLNTQCLEPINACQECQYSSVKPQNPWADYVDDGWNPSDVVDKCSGDGNEFEAFDGWAEGMVWTNSSIPQLGWTGDVPAAMNIQGPEQLGWAPGNQLYYQLDRLDHLTPWPDDQIWVPQISGDDELLVESLESVDEFMIGAHNAPHSSEVELCVPPEGEELNMSRRSLSRMSGAELSAAVRRHTGSLRRLLREARQRRKYRSTLSLDVCAPDHFGLAPRDFFSTDYSYEAIPTKEVSSTPLPPFYLSKDMPLPPTNQCKVGFTTLLPKIQCTDDFRKFANPCRDIFTPASPTNLYRDGFLAGSHRNKVPLGFIGRGRGRLQEDRRAES